MKKIISIVIIMISTLILGCQTPSISNDEKNRIESVRTTLTDSLDYSIEAEQSSFQFQDINTVTKSKSTLSKGQLYKLTCSKSDEENSFIVYYGKFDNSSSGKKGAKADYEKKKANCEQLPNITSKEVQNTNGTTIYYVNSDLSSSATTTDTAEDGTVTASNESSNHKIFYVMLIYSETQNEVSVINYQGPMTEDEITSYSTEMLESFGWN